MNKNNNFTMIHMTSAIMVIIGHQFVLMGMVPPVLFGIDIQGFGVRTLFVVSGFLVSASYNRCNSPLAYIYKRIYRLFPPLILCLLLSILFLRVVTTQPEVYWYSAMQYFLHNIELRPKFDLAGVFTSNVNTGVNGSLWTLPIEFVCYLLLIPIMEIVKYTKKYSKLISGAMIVGILGIFSAIDYWRTICSNGATLVFWDTDWFNGISLGIWFMIGVAFQVMELDKYCNWQVALVIFIVYSCCSSKLGYVLMPYVLSYGIFCFGLEEKPFFRDTFKNDICYGIYLYAFPIQQFFISIMRSSSLNNVYFMAILSIIITFVVANFVNFLENEYVIVLKKLFQGDKRIENNRRI